MRARAKSASNKSAKRHPVKRRPNRGEAGLMRVIKRGRKFVMVKKNKEAEAEAREDEIRGERDDALAAAQTAADEITPIDVDATGVRPEGHAAPTVTELSPNTAVCGDNVDIRMYVIGTGFTKASVITFNGLDEPTTFHDATRVSTGVKPSLFVVPAVCPVGVRNPGYAATGTVDFTFTEAEAAPEGGA